ncbi:MAG: regulatory protein GemA [Gammaproteobacteria bacterium]|nr:regulatory protein GemA [Gammaproteobacteria bacterium]
MSSHPTIDPRRRLYTLLQVGRQTLGLDEDSYRAILAAYGAREVDGRPSATTMSVSQLEQALEHQKHLGFRPRRRPGRADDWRQPRIDKIARLWSLLRDAGVLRDGSQRARDRFCARQTGTARLDWASSAQLNQVIEALKSWCDRERVAHD